MVLPILKYFHPGKWITSFACWWLHIDNNTLEYLVNKNNREDGQQSLPQAGKEYTLEVDSPSSTKSCKYDAESDEFIGYRALWVAAAKEKVTSWDFNVFDLHLQTNGNPLYAVTIALLEMLGLLDGWKLNRKKVERFMIRVEKEYCLNSYHNNTHAADVTQTAAIILQCISQHMKEISKHEIFCIILASAIHDLGHLGVNNDFLINSKHQRATTYNDKSVNEMFHVCRAFEIARESEECDIFDGMTLQEQKQIRKTLIDLVLATDMAIHFELLSNFNREADVTTNLDEWKDRNLIFQMVVHLADIANPSRPFPIARRWAERVIQEFVEQGDREASIGLPVTPFCNRSTMCMPRAQLGFINIFLKPTLICFEKAAPEFARASLEGLEKTAQEWAALEATGFKY